MLAIKYLFAQVYFFLIIVGPLLMTAIQLRSGLKILTKQTLIPYKAQRVLLAPIYTWAWATVFGLVMSFLILSSVLSNLPSSESMGYLQLTLPTVMPVSTKKVSAGALMSAPPKNFIQWVRFFNGLYFYDVDGSKLSLEQAMVKYKFYLSFSKYVRVPFQPYGPVTKPQLITLAEPELDHQRLRLFGVELFLLAQKNSKLLLLWKYKQKQGALTLTQSFQLLLTPRLVR